MHSSFGHDDQFFGPVDQCSQKHINIDGELHYTSSMPPDAPDVVKRIVNEDIRTIYKLGKLIGSGNFGTVRLASSKSNPQKVFAIKSIPREIIDKEIGMLEQELLILMEVDHPNIIKFYETYRDKKYYHIVMEFCEGGELFEHLVAIGKFTEADAANIIR